AAADHDAPGGRRRAGRRAAGVPGAPRRTTLPAGREGQRPVPLADDDVMRVDGWRREGVRRPRPGRPCRAVRAGVTMPKKRILILGGGFGGVYAALKLDKTLARDA